MRIDGRQIAERILNQLAGETAQLKQKGVTPTLAVILVGADPGSLSYIKQKQNAAAKIGASVLFKQLPQETSTAQLKALIAEYNQNRSVHGLIVQRPLPKTLVGATEILNSVLPQKDVDGFVPNSPFPVPVVAAVFTILEEIFNIEKFSHTNSALTNLSFAAWLKNQCVAVVGRGETAGKPIADALGQTGCTLSVVHSQTQHPEEVIRKLNIVISCAGKPRVVTPQMLAPRTILISVGIWRDANGKLHGDYEEEEIKEIAAYYTPTPGGVGPVNVASLMQNLVKAAKSNNSSLNL